MSLSDWMFWTGYLLPVGAAVAGLFGWLHERREKRSEIAKREKAEAEVRTIRSRGEAPFLVVSESCFVQLILGPKHNPNGGSGWADPKGKRLLCFCREEVDRSLPEGEAVHLVLENVKDAVVQWRLELDGQPIDIQMGRAPEAPSCQKILYLTYLYSPPKHGTQQQLHLWFESKSGFQDVHIYSLVHGKRQLQRLSP